MIKSRRKERKRRKRRMWRKEKAPFNSPIINLKIKILKSNCRTNSQNLRNLKSEGSLLEDRYKSMQKRNVIETRVPQKIVKKAHKRKKFEKKSYKMGWEPKGYTPFEKIP